MPWLDVGIMPLITKRAGTVAPIPREPSPPAHHESVRQALLSSAQRQQGCCGGRGRWGFRHALHGRHETRTEGCHCSAAVRAPSSANEAGTREWTTVRGQNVAVAV